MEQRVKIKNLDSDFLNEFFSSISLRVADIDLAVLHEVSNLVLRAHGNGGKLILVGNGGSAAMASHVSVDFTKSAKIRAINFNEADLLTCFSNDYGYQNWVSFALDAYSDQHDVVILISSSGQSPNVINGALQAQKLGLKTVTLSGFESDNPLRKLGDFNLWCDSRRYNIVEMTHHIWLLAIVDYIIYNRECLDA